MPWGKMPFRDPSERLARVGQGFSHMLSSLNVDSAGLSRYESRKMLPPMKDANEVMNTIPGDRAVPMTNRRVPAAMKTSTKFPMMKKPLGTNSQERRPISASKFDG